MCRDLERLRGRVNEAGLGEWRYVDGVAGDMLRLAAKQALQQCRGFDEPTGLDQAGRSQHVGAAWGLVHDEASLSGKRARFSVRSLTGLPRPGG
jgi:hypothetical protein